jgi:hypothetical protein
MTPPDLRNRPPPNGHDPHAQGRIIISHVRMNVTQKEGGQTLSIPSILHKILNSLRDVDNKATFEDIQRKPFSLETFPSDKEKFDAAFGTVIKDGRSTQVILGFTIKSSNTLGSLKQAILPVLQRCGTFLRPHLSNTWERLDTITIGHLHLVHPTFADADDLKQKMTIQIQETVDRIHTTPEYLEHVSKEFEVNGVFIHPEIMFSPGRAQGKLDNHDIASDVIDVYVARASAPSIKYLLEASTENSTRPLALVPRDFKYNQPDIYAKLLSTQNDYLEKHRNIGLVAISTDAMLYQKVTDLHGQEWQSMYAAISQGPGIAQINASKRTYDLGKWNISTTHDEWESVKSWLDTHLLPLYNSIPATVRQTYASFGDFTEPQRLQFRTSNRIATGANPNAYAQRIQTQLLGNVSVPTATTPKPPAWKAKRPKLVWTFNESEFPPMPAQPPKQTTCDDLSTGSQPSTATTNSLTTTTSIDDSIKKLQAQWKKQKAALETDFKAQLTTMDSTVLKVMNRMDAIDTRIDTKMSNMQTSLQNMIITKLDTTALVAQVAAAIGGADSPFVTAASLKATMEGFIKQVNSRIDNLIPAITPENPSKRKKPLNANTADDMDEDENEDIAAAAKKAAGRK